MKVEDRLAVDEFFAKYGSGSYSGSFALKIDPIQINDFKTCFISGRFGDVVIVSLRTHIGVVAPKEGICLAVDRSDVDDILDSTGNCSIEKIKDFYEICLI